MLIVAEGPPRVGSLALAVRLAVFDAGGYPMQMSQQRSRRIRGVVSLGTGVAVSVALGSSLLYFLWVASIRDSEQIGQLSIGTFVVGLACAFAALMLDRKSTRLNSSHS